MNEFEEKPSNNSSHSSVPTHYIVEINGRSGPAYAVCERVLLIEEGHEVIGIPAEEIHAYLVDHQVLAAPLPAKQSRALSIRGGRVSVEVRGGSNIVNVGVGDGDGDKF